MYYPFESAPTGLQASSTLSGAALSMFVFTVVVAAAGLATGFHSLFLIAGLTALGGIGVMTAKTANVLSAPAHGPTR